jgi:hypothetical protein
VWNAWHRLKVGGFISADVRSVGTSDAATVLQASMRPSMQRRRGIRSLPALSRVRTGFTITRNKGWSRVWNYFRRIRIQQVSPLLDLQAGCQPTGNPSYTSCPPKQWGDKGAFFLTEPLDNHGWEWRCYMRDPDGYLIQVGQYTQIAFDWFKNHS